MTKRILERILAFFSRRHSPWKIAAVLFLFSIVGAFLMFGWWAKTHLPIQQTTLTDVLKKFADDYVFYIWFYALVVTLVIPLVLWLADKVDPTGEEERIRQSQKQRMQILNRFAPKQTVIGLFSKWSIYNAIISTLTRLDQKKEAGNFQVCLLLCSPALDHPDKPKKPDDQWGHEFEQLINHLLNHENIHMDICYLPSKPMLGFNPMDDFLFVLANLISKMPDEFSRNFDMLKKQTDRIAGDIEEKAKRHERFKIWPPMLNVPFQIVLVASEEFNEVVVSFAGREILESGKDPKGFFSSDPYVVDTFQKIYWDYVRQEGRLPFVPPLTSGVIEKHNQRPVHEIVNYLGVIPNLAVDGCFSPAFANSSKFTSWVITKVLTKDDTPVLDIGSGTGVLALMAQKTIQRDGVPTPRIVAVESDDKSLQTLKKNCPTNLGFEVKNWRLSPKLENGTQVGGCFLDMGDGGKEVPRDQVGRFKVIIADLPFVDVKESLAKDLRFFDPEHKAHKTLFMGVKDWLADNGRLITAFSSLGGPADVLRFERLIAENDLQIVQRFDFHESNYLWIVHVIVKSADFDPENYWWDKLGARQFATA